MNVKFTATQPDNIEMTVSLTMPLKNWRLLSQQLSTAWPSSELSMDIDSVVRQALKNFCPLVDTERDTV